jgi:uncharacterized coiled-coil protein SlyX
MDKINSMTLFHIGTEFVVIAGVSFWLNRRISSLEEQINIQNETINKYEELINQQGQMLMRHEQIIRQITGAPPLSGPQPGNTPKSGPKPPAGPKPSSRPPQLPQTPVSSIPTEVEPHTQVEESDISDTELDKLIGNDELSILKGQQSRKVKKEQKEDHIELICADDQCDLKNQEMEINIKKRKRGKGKRVRRTIP